MEEQRMMVQTRIPISLLKAVGYLAVDLGTTRQGAIEHLIRVGLEAEREKKEKGYGSDWLGSVSET